MRQRLTTRVPAIVCVGLALVACSQGGTTAQPSEDAGRSAPVEEHATPLDAAEEDVSEVRSEADTQVPPPNPVAIFVKLVEQSCDSKHIPDPALATAGPAKEGAVVITDADGDQVRLNVNERIVTSLQGRDGELPPDYSFGCDPQVFLGTSH